VSGKGTILLTGAAPACSALHGADLLQLAADAQHGINGAAGIRFLAGQHELGDLVAE
jgi:hypothetical protein